MCRMLNQEQRQVGSSSGKQSQFYLSLCIKLCYRLSIVSPGVRWKKTRIFKTIVEFRFVEPLEEGSSFFSSGTYRIYIYIITNQIYINKQKQHCPFINSLQYKGLHQDLGKSLEPNVFREGITFIVSMYLLVIKRKSFVDLVLELLYRHLQSLVTYTLWGLVLNARFILIFFCLHNDFKTIFIKKHVLLVLQITKQHHLTHFKLGLGGRAGFFLNKQVLVVSVLLCISCREEKSTHFLNRFFQVRKEINCEHS